MTTERDFYEEVMGYTRRERERAFTGPVVVRGKDRPWRQERQGFVKYYLWPSRYSGGPAETPVDDWAVFTQEIRVHSGRHRHQGGLAIHILEGEGYSIVDGVRYDWEAGDLLMLPLKVGGVEHQHFNRYEDVPAKWVAFINAALYDWGGSELVQLQDHPDWRGRGSGEEPAISGQERAAAATGGFGVAGGAGPAARAGRGVSSHLGGQAGGGALEASDDPRAGGRAVRSKTLLDWLFELRDTQRALREEAPAVLKARDVPWEWNANGKMQWFLHPAMERTAIPSLVVYVQEIPPGGRTGRQRVPGGAVLFMLRGKGYTLLDGERHDWEAEDCLNLPIRPQGTVVQHVNQEAERSAAFISVELSLVHTLGVDRGSAFEQIEMAPEP